MSERILQALMQLFAIGATIDRLTVQSRESVEKFLRQQISYQRIPEYLSLFDQHFGSLSGTKDGAAGRKKLSVSSVKALRICTEINKELTLRQKYIVFLRFAEFMQTSGEELSTEENELLETVATVFSLDQTEIKLILHLSGKRSFPNNDFNSELSLIINDTNKEQNINAHHLTQEDISGELIFIFIRSARLFFLKYTGNDNLTLNGQPVTTDTVSVLAQGAVIRGTGIEAIYFSDLSRQFLFSEKSQAFIFETNEIEHKFPNGKTGLHSLSFTAEAGQLIGIMGGSGAGKSTLLNVLNGSLEISSGQILLNGNNLYSDKKKANELIGNIPQDDLLIEELTVFENLYFNAKLCFGDADDQEIKRRVLEMLESLGLSEIKDLKVGSPLNKTISGGQRKRLNISLELIRKPFILFVDEPTSGLSSRDAENVMDLLKQLSLQGNLVFVVIHQPASDVFRMFDKLLLMDNGGYPVYFGNPSDSLVYFKRHIHHTDAEESECPFCGNINPEQLFNIIEMQELDEFGNQTGNRKIPPLSWNELFKKNHPENSNQKIPQNLAGSVSAIKAGKFKQWKIFFTRDFISKISNKQYLLINLIEAPVLAFILGFVLRYFPEKNHYTFFANPNIPAFIFISVLVSLFLGLSVSAEEIIRDRKIVKRERFLNLNKNSYLLSKVSILFLISAIQSLSFVIIGNLLIGISGLNLFYFLVLFSTSCFANLLGLNISSAFNSAVTVYILIPFILIPQIMLSGVMVRFDRLNPLITRQDGVPLIGNLMASRWAFEALAVTQFADNYFEKQIFPLDETLSRAQYRKDWWISAVRERVDKSERLLLSNSSKDSLQRQLTLVENEILPESNFAIPKAENFSHDDVISLRKKLDDLQEYYINHYNSANDRKEEWIQKQTDSPEREQTFIAMKNKYENESLDDLVRNRNQKDKIILVDNHLLQRSDPIFKFQDNTFFKNDFFAYRKNLLSSQVKTIYANTFIIWMMTLILYFMLSGDILRKLINFNSKEKN